MIVNKSYYILILLFVLKYNKTFDLVYCTTLIPYYLKKTENKKKINSFNLNIKNINQIGYYNIKKININNISLKAFCTSCCFIVILSYINTKNKILKLLLACPSSYIITLSLLYYYELKYKLKKKNYKENQKYNNTISNKFILQNNLYNNPYNIIKEINNFNPDIDEEYIIYSLHKKKKIKDFNICQQLYFLYFYFNIIEINGEEYDVIKYYNYINNNQNIINVIHSNQLYLNYYKLENIIKNIKMNNLNESIQKTIDIINQISENSLINDILKNIYDREIYNIELEVDKKSTYISKKKIKEIELYLNLLDPLDENDFKKKLNIKIPIDNKIKEELLNNKEDFILDNITKKEKDELFKQIYKRYFILYMHFFFIDKIPYYSEFEYCFNLFNDNNILDQLNSFYNMQKLLFLNVTEHKLYRNDKYETFTISELQSIFLIRKQYTEQNVIILYSKDQKKDKRTDILYYSLKIEAINNNEDNNENENEDNNEKDNEYKKNKKKFINLSPLQKKKLGTILYLFKYVIVLIIITQPIIYIFLKTNMLTINLTLFFIIIPIYYYQYYTLTLESEEKLLTLINDLSSLENHQCDPLIIIEKFECLYPNFKEILIINTEYKKKRIKDYNIFQQIYYIYLYLYNNNLKNENLLILNSYKYTDIIQLHLNSLYCYYKDLIKNIDKIKEIHNLKEAINDPLLKTFNFKAKHNLNKKLEIIYDKNYYKIDSPLENDNYMSKEFLKRSYYYLKTLDTDFNINLKNNFPINNIILNELNNNEEEFILEGISKKEKDLIFNNIYKRFFIIYIFCYFEEPSPFNNFDNIVSYYNNTLNKIDSFNSMQKLLIESIINIKIYLEDSYERFSAEELKFLFTQYSKTKTKENFYDAIPQNNKYLD